MPREQNSENQPKPLRLIALKLPHEEADKLKSAARRETDGNVSEFIRRAVRDRIETAERIERAA